MVSPGVPLDTPELVQARNFGRPVIGELELAARFLRGKILAVTGSNGKTTTTSLLGEILEKSGVPTQVGGNIGVPVVALIDESTDETWNVLEVSSFQLESTEQFHPNIAVILNITPDHLDRHGTFENYALAKERIFSQQTENDYCVLNADNVRAASSAGRSKAQVFWFSLEHTVAQGAWVEGRRYPVPLQRPVLRRETVMPLSSIPLKGEHKRRKRNAGRGVCCATRRRLRQESVRHGRRYADRSRPSSIAWNIVTTLNGVEIYNDSKATNVDATAQGDCGVSRQHSPDSRRKGQELRLHTELSDLLRSRVKAVYTIGSAAAKIESQLRGIVAIHSCETMEKAISAIAAAAHPGDVVLLAPACSSFDQFESYEHRGRVFKGAGERMARHAWPSGSAGKTQPIEQGAGTGRKDCENPRVVIPQAHRSTLGHDPPNVG